MKDKYRYNLIKNGAITVLVSVSFISGYSYSNNLSYPMFANGYNEVSYRQSDAVKEFRDIESIIDEESKWIARALYGIDENNDDDKRTYASCIIIRYYSSKYANTIEEVVNQSGQWILYDKDNTVTSHNYALARELVEMMHLGILPTGDSFLYVEWSRERVILKNSYDNPTLGWRWGEGEFVYGK